MTTTLVLCEHIKPGGRRCGSPALRDKRFCYYHEKLQCAMPTASLFYEKLPDAPPGTFPYILYSLPPLEDAASVQIAYMQVVYGIANGHLDPKKARVILSAIHGAAKNLRLMDKAILRASDVLPEQEAEESSVPKKAPAAEKSGAVERASRA